MPNDVRHTHWLIKLMLIVGFGFVTFDFIELTFLTRRTDEFFSWTIQIAVTAAVFGSFYLAASLITLSAFPQRAWVRARSAVPGTYALVVLIELATLYNFGPFREHLHAARGITNFEFWLWIGAYTVEPIGLTIGMLLQRKMPGVDPPTIEPLPAWWRNCAWVGGVGAVVVGAFLFLLPQAAINIWSWPLNRLTAQVLGSWFVASGLVMAWAAHENDKWRLLVPALGFTVLGPVQLIAIARFSDDIDFGNLQIWGHLAFLVGVTVLGVIGLVWALKAKHPYAAEAPPMPVAAAGPPDPGAPAFTA
ncbi:MAG TPA: hypothetical protein VNN79_04925 [Actinomycetota bacterium]|nr:hypothetical protein [Actinomycetota bacterium]